MKTTKHTTYRLSKSNKLIHTSWIPWKSSFRYIRCQFTPKMKANTVPCLISSLVWIDQYNEWNWMTSFMEFMWTDSLSKSHLEAVAMTRSPSNRPTISKYLHNVITENYWMRLWFKSPCSAGTFCEIGLCVLCPSPGVWQGAALALQLQMSPLITNAGEWSRGTSGNVYLSL